MGRKLAAGTSGERAANATNPRRWWRGGGMGGGHLAAISVIRLFALLPNQAICTES